MPFLLLPLSSHRIAFFFQYPKHRIHTHPLISEYISVITVSRAMSDLFSHSFNNRETRGLGSVLGLSPPPQSQPPSILSKCYCHRCKRFCTHESALRQHVRDSLRHNVCK